jgi:acetyl esterase
MQKETMPALPPVPASLREEMRRIGPVWGEDVGTHIARMTEAFSEVLSAAPDRGVSRRDDIAYGEHPRQRLDIFHGPRSGNVAGAPALLFVHGGAFVKGNRNKTPEIYSNVLRYFASHGVVGVNIGYRLADVVQYPGATEDIAAAVAWIRAHACELDIDRDRIFLMGHSAGGAHVGSYGYNTRFHPAEGPGLAGLILVSGRVRADVLPENPNAAKVVAYYGSDPKVHEEASSVTHVTADSLPTFVAWAEYENPLIDLHSAELVHALSQAKRRSPPMYWLRGHNHTSSIAHINTEEETLAREILAFIRDPR